MTLAEIVKDLQRCARQNEKDAKGYFTASNCDMARAIAGEQRRMIKILKTAIKELTNV